MIEAGYTTIDEVVDILARNPLTADIPIDTIVRETGDFIRTMGLAGMEVVTTKLEVTNHRAILPPTLLKIDRVLVHGQRAKATTTLHTEDKGEPFPLYSVKGRVLFVTLKDGKVELSYKSVPTDQRGYPLIPDLPSFKEALTARIKAKQYAILSDINRLSRATRDYADRDYAIAVKRLHNDITMPSPDELDAALQPFQRIVPRKNTLDSY